MTLHTFTPSSVSVDYPDTVTLSSGCSAATAVNEALGEYGRLPGESTNGHPVWRQKLCSLGCFDISYQKEGEGWQCARYNGAEVLMRTEPKASNVPPCVGWLYRDPIKHTWNTDPLLTCLPRSPREDPLIPVNGIPPTAIPPPPPVTEPSSPWTTVYFSPQGHNDGTELVRDNLLTTLPSLGKEWRVTHEFRPTDYSAKGWTNSLHLTTEGNKKRMPAIFFHASKGMVVAFPKDNSSNTKHYIKEDDRPAINEWTRIKIAQELLKGKYMITITIGCKKVFEVQNNKPNKYSEVQVFTSNPFYAAHPGSIRNFIIETKTDSFTGCIS